MNPSQLTGILRLFVPTIIGVATTYLGAGTVNTILAILAAFVAAAGASAYANTTTNLTQTVAALPGVKVAVSPAASPELLKLASDPNVPDVVHAPVPPAPPAKDPYLTAARRQ